jgi:ribosomal protein S18 acetylase RimI-like enzyme
VRATVKVDRYGPDDLTGVYRVCLETGDAGSDATALHDDPNLLGHVYVGPYACLQPNHAFVLRDGDEVLGYALGALDTAAFERACEARWWPPLRAMYPRDRDRRPRDAELVGRIHTPERTPDGLLADWPSHLHIDLRRPAQGRGFGRAMIEAVVASLREAGSRGIHLGVARTNARAIGFYEHLGWRRLREDGDALLMGFDPT